MDKWNEDKKEKGTKNRRRMLAVLNIIEECEYKNKVITIEEIINMLEVNYRIEAERKAIIKDLQAIDEVTKYNIQYQKKIEGYVIENKEKCKVEDIEIIKRALMAAKFISKEDTRALLERVRKGSTKGMRLEGSIKSSNANIIDNIKLINKAISSNHKVKFDYIKTNEQLKEYTDKKNCIVSPFAQVWFQDFYYLLGSYNDEFISYYRLDRIKDLEILKDSRINIYKITGKVDKFDPIEYIKKAVGMSSGTEVMPMRVKVKKKCIGRIKDKFGENIWISNVEKDETILNINVLYNKELIPWLLSLEDGIEVLEPNKLRNEIKSKLEKIKNIYN